MKTKRGSMTARELFEQQAVDPAYQAMRSARDRELAEITQQRAREQEPLLSDLAAAGAAVDWVGRLCSIPDPDKRIYPVLLEHLSRTYSAWLLEWIGRAFGRKSARPIVWDTLVALIKAHTLEQPAVDGVMIAISEIAQPRDLATLIDLLSDRAIGGSRIFLVDNLMRSKRPDARTALVRHQGDPDLAKEIIARIARIRG